MNQALRTLLATEPYVGLSADEAAQLAAAPTKTPKGATVDLRSLGGVWGLARAVKFRAYLAALVAGVAGPDAAAFAAALLDLLGGPGFDPANPEVAGAVVTLVKLGACTPDEAEQVLVDVSYPAGAPVTADEVKAERAEIARRATIGADIRAVMAWLNDVGNAAFADPAARYVPPAEYFAAPGGGT
jgi:hypothetical protein